MKILQYNPDQETLKSENTKLKEHVKDDLR